MKLSDFVPSKATLEGLQGVETQLQSRRYAGNWSLAVAVLASAFKIAQLVGSEKAFNDLLNPRQWSWQHFVDAVTSGKGILYLIAFVAAGIWVMLRYTGFLFKQSQSPFRYTFSIEPFTQVKDTPAGFVVEGLDQMNLLTNDLIERLKRRVQRFSFLEKAGADGTAAIAKGLNATSHFHIKAEYAVRKDESDEWVMHVWPRIRIGAEGNAFTLANPVRLPFVARTDPGESTAKGVLNLDEYQRLIERVYSSIATEIYKQIEIDLRDKMTLFPTLSLRALARYVEAEDFETSNTIDAYDRALDMYQTSLDEMKASVLHKCRKFFKLTSALEAEAKTKLGYSRCQIYRRLVSEMAARDRHPIFESRKMLEEAFGLLRQAYNSFFYPKPRKGRPLPDTVEETKPQELLEARDAVAWPLYRKRAYHRVRAELCEALAVGGLANSLLDGLERADRMLELAKTLADPGSDSVSATDCPDRVSLILLLTKAELEPRLQAKLSALSEAIELNLDSEIALYRHAYYSDLLARDGGEFTKEKVEWLCRKYDEALRANPANVASLFGQGYLLWLADEPAEGRRKFLSGIELQKIVKRTFVGDLKYCLGRIEVEEVDSKIRALEKMKDPPKKMKVEIGTRLRKAVFRYQEAIDADPMVAASYTDQMGKTQNSYFNRINSRILERYKKFADRAGHVADYAHRYEWDARDNADILLSYALNDYGNACLTYYLRFEYYTGSEESLNRSLNALERASRLNPDSVMIQYNRFLTAAWKRDLKESDIRKLHQDTVALPFPVRVSVVIQAVRQNLVLPDFTTTEEKAGIRDIVKGHKFTETYRNLLKARIYWLNDRIDELMSQIAKEARAQNRPGQKLPSVPETRSLAASGGSQPGLSSGSGDVPQMQQLARPDDADSTYGALPAPAGATRKPQKKGQSRPLEVQQDPKEKEKGECQIQVDLLRKRLRLDMLEEPVRQSAAEITRLGDPVADRLRCVRIPTVRQDLATKTETRAALTPKEKSDLVALETQEKGHLEELEKGLLDTALLKEIGFGSQLRDEEVSVLFSLVQIWSARSDDPEKYDRETKDGIVEICRFLFSGEYRLDDFDLNWAAFLTAPEEEKEEKDRKEKYLEKVARAVDQSFQQDPQSCYFRGWALDVCFERVKIFKKRGEFKKAAELLEEEQERCGAFPIFHDLLARAYEDADRAEKQLADKVAAAAPIEGDGAEPYDGEAWVQASGRVLAEREKCRRLEPANADWRDAQLVACGRALVLGNTFEDPLRERIDRKLLEVEFSSQSLPDLEITSDLSPELKETITDLRSFLKQDFGFTLPGINFRDNPALPKGQFRVLTRGLPSRFDSLPGAGKVALEHLTRRLRWETTINAASLFWVDDCLGKLLDTAETRFDGMQNSPQTLAELTWVSQALLAEGASIAEFGPIASAFRDCRSRGLGLILTLEEIRGLPEVRKRLRGNSLGEPLWIVRLPPDLDRRVEQSIDFKSGEPVFNGTSVLVSEVCSVAREAFFSADGVLVVLLTSAAVRPFVRNMIAPLDVTVLSYREILPSLLSQVKEPNAVAKTVQAAAGD